MSEVIERIKQRITNPKYAIELDEAISRVIYPPANEIEIREAETSLGFSLPTFLRQLYLEIGNGGFGPGYGIIGLPSGAKDDLGKDIIELYKDFSSPDPKDSLWKWRNRLLPICHLGCAMYACVDCNTVQGAMIWFEPNAHNEDIWDNCFIPLADSLEEWLNGWLEDKDYLREAWERKFGVDPFANDDI